VVGFGEAHVGDRAGLVLERGVAGGDGDERVPGAVHEEQRGVRHGLVVAALVGQAAAGHRDGGVDAVVDAARVVGHAERRRRAQRVAADGDVVGVGHAGERVVAGQAQHLVDHEAHVPRLVLHVVAEPDALAAQRERRQRHHVALPGPPLAVRAEDVAPAVEPVRPDDQGERALGGRGVLDRAGGLDGVDAGAVGPLGW
jgi:hypothetical protein